jgi:hypothetical protein
MDIDAIRSALVSHALTVGLFDTVQNHEAKSAPGNGVSCEFWAASIRPEQSRSGLLTTSGLVVISARVRKDMKSKPEDDIDAYVLKAVHSLMIGYSGDFELGGTTTCVDLLGMSGVALSAEFGYLEQDSRLYRVGVITIPILVDDVWSQAA